MCKKSLFIISFIFLFFSQSTEAQDKLNQYQYILIPEQFSFQNVPNEYNINELLKLSFEKYNFKSFIKGENISDIAPCSLLRLNVSKTGFMSTKMTLIFDDCYGKNIYTSIEGKSRIKEFRPAFYEALKEAMKDSNIQNHSFNTNNTLKQESVATNKSIKSTVLNNKLEKDATVLMLRNKKYLFVKKGINYHIYLNNNKIGTATKQNNSSVYYINTSNLKGEGYFDDFGNFTLTRTNPVNNKQIEDIMERIN